MSAQLFEQIEGLSDNELAEIGYRPRPIDEQTADELEAEREKRR